MKQLEISGQFEVNSSVGVCFCLWIEETFDGSVEQMCSESKWKGAQFHWIWQTKPQSTSLVDGNEVTVW